MESPSGFGWAFLMTNSSIYSSAFGRILCNDICKLFWSRQLSAMKNTTWLSVAILPKSATSSLISIRDWFLYVLRVCKLRRISLNSLILHITFRFNSHTFSWHKKNGIPLKRGIPLLLFWPIIAVHHLEIVVTSGFDFLMCFKVVRD